MLEFGDQMSLQRGISAFHRSRWWILPCNDVNSQETDQAVVAGPGEISVDRRVHDIGRNGASFDRKTVYDIISK